MRGRKHVRQDAASWWVGYNAGINGGLEVCPPAVPDKRGYASGYVEGKAAGARRKVTLGRFSRVCDK